MKTWILALGAVVVLAGCGGNKQGGTTAPSAPGGKTLRVGIVTDKGGVGDQSFNASAWRGAQRAQSELGVEARYAQSTVESDYARNLRGYAKQGYDAVFAIGYLEQDAYNQVSKEFPNTKFIIIDGESAKLPNTAAVRFKEQDGSYLAGALAAAMSKSGTIGFIGGMHGSVIDRFEYGYRAGALKTRPDIKILVQYTESWDDSNKGQSMATLQFGQGADIIFHAAGKCGLGVINAAKEQPAGKYAIGVDSDQDHLAPGKVLTSMVKRVDNAVFDTTKKLKDGQFTPGDHIYGLKEDGVGLSEMKYTKTLVPADVMKKVDADKAEIVSGKITPPGTKAEFDAFCQANNLKP